MESIGNFTSGLKHVLKRPGMKKHLLFIVIFNLFGLLLYAQQPISLNDAIALTMANNPQVKQGESSQMASIASVDKVKSNYYPQVAANANYTRIDPTGFAPFPTGQGVKDFSFIPNDNYNFNLTLQMTVFDFGRTHVGLQIAKNGEALAANNLVLTKQELAFATIQIYYQIYFLQEAIKVQGRQIEALNLNLSQTKKLQENGEATHYEILTTEVKVSSAIDRKADLQTALNNAIIQLKQLTGQDNINIGAIDNNWMAVENPNAMSANTDVTQRAEFKLSELQSENATLQEMLAKRNFYPFLSANVQGGYKNAIQPNINEIALNYVASAQLTIPIFSGFKNKAALAEAQALNDAAEFNLENTSNLLLAEVKQSVENLNNSYQKIERSQLQVSQAQKAAELARLKYTNGVITNLDLLDAEIALSESEINKLNTIFNYTINTYHLKKALGIDLF